MLIKNYASTALETSAVTPTEGVILNDVSGVRGMDEFVLTIGILACVNAHMGYRITAASEEYQLSGEKFIT